MEDPADLEVTIVDGYVDEPAHFGVPPYVSTYPRFAAGAAVDAGVPRDAVTYHTIDELREDHDKKRDVIPPTYTKRSASTTSRFLSWSSRSSSMVWEVTASGGTPASTAAPAANRGYVETYGGTPKWAGSST